MRCTVSLTCSPNWLRIPTQTLAVIFDTARKTFRSNIYPDYKAHRPPPPEELLPQFDLIREATRAYSLPCLEMEGFEADDLIATYARLAVEQGYDVTIVSSDKDLMQLVGPGVRMMDPMKNRFIGPDEVVEKFGVGPENVVDVQSLLGDSTDNVPGIKGIGEAPAAALVREYGDLEGILKAVEDPDAVKAGAVKRRRLAKPAYTNWRDVTSASVRRSSSKKC